MSDIEIIRQAGAKSRCKIAPNIAKDMFVSISMKGKKTSSSKEGNDNDLRRS